MRNSGFKVYEMIVVIAILMVLAGLLMPVLRNARLKTIEDVCASNLSQIHQAVLLYEQEHGRLWEGPLSFQTGLRPYLGDTFLSCPLALPRKTKPWIKRAPYEDQVEEYYVFGLPPFYLADFRKAILECQKRLGERAPVASCHKHYIRLVPPGPVIFIRRSGELVMAPAEVVHDVYTRLSDFEIHGKNRGLPCPNVPVADYNIP
jgi:hypothetical protein